MAEIRTSLSSDTVEALRRFSRFYTRKLGLLEDVLLKSGFSLTEARVLYELSHREGLTAADLVRELRADAGYLSRILKAFEARGFVTRTPAPGDARQTLLTLTDHGRAAYGPLDRAARDQAAALLDGLAPHDLDRLTGALKTVERLLDDPAPTPPPYTLRPHRVGDIGWIVHRQGVLYAQEYGWDETYEALVAEIAANFVKNFDPARERCWVAEREGEIVGSVFLVKESDAVAKLRLLYVEPSARGLGLGRRLTRECIRFARAKGYTTLTLWTNDVLVSARRVYESAGFRLVSEQPHRSFGHDLVGQTWELDL